MEDFHVDVRLSDGPHAQTLPMNIERFTLIGATTRFGLLTPPMRARFGLVERLSFYPPEDLMAIVLRSAGVLNVPIDPAGAAEIAQRSRGTPRVANRLLRRVRDYAEVRADGRITGGRRDRGAGAAQRRRVRPRRHGHAGSSAPSSRSSTADRSDSAPSRRRWARMPRPSRKCTSRT